MGCHSVIVLLNLSVDNDVITSRDFEVMVIQCTLHDVIRVPAVTGKNNNNNIYVDPQTDIYTLVFINICNLVVFCPFTFGHHSD